MKARILSTTFGLALGLLGWVDGAIAEQGLRLTYDMGGVPVTVLRDAAGTVQFDGLPYPGLVLYKPKMRMVFYQHPDEPTWLVISPEAVNGYGAIAKFNDGGAWQPYLDAPTKRWEVRTANMACDNWFTSKKAAEVSGLTAADLMRVLAALQWLHAGKAATPCERLEVKDIDAVKVGLPLYLNGPSGLWQLTELTQTEIDPIVVPVNPSPADDGARLRVLMYQFEPERRMEILNQVGQMPLAQQLEEIQRMLSEESGLY